MTKRQNLAAILFSGIALLAITSVPHAKESIVDVDPVSHESKKQILINSLEDLNKFHQGPVTSPVKSQWVTAVQTDSFGEKPIFANLSTYEPFSNILKKGIVSYERKTLRTPDYHSEEGYDLIVYEIHHPLSKVSKILAYFDKSIEPPALKVVFLTGRPGVGTVDFVEFDGGALASQREIAWADADQLFSRHLMDASVLMNASIK